MLLILLMDFAILAELASEEADDIKEKTLERPATCEELGKLCRQLPIEKKGLI